MCEVSGLFGIAAEIAVERDGNCLRFIDSRFDSIQVSVAFEGTV